MACEDKDRAEERLRPDLAEAVGSEIRSIPREDLQEYEVSGLPFSLDHVEVVRILSHRLVVSGRKWTCIPGRRLPNKQPGRKSMIVLASEPPQHSLLKIRHGYMVYPVIIRPRAPPKKHADSIKRLEKAIEGEHAADSDHDMDEDGGSAWIGNSAFSLRGNERNSATSHKREPSWHSLCQSDLEEVGVARQTRKTQDPAETAAAGDDAEGADEDPEALPDGQFYHKSDGPAVEDGNRGRSPEPSPSPARDHRSRSNSRAKRPVGRLPVVPKQRPPILEQLE